MTAVDRIPEFALKSSPSIYKKPSFSHNNLQKTYSFFKYLTIYIL